MKKVAESDDKKRFSHHKLDLIGGGTDSKWVLAGPNGRVISGIECTTIRSTVGISGLVRPSGDMYCVF